MPALRSSSVSAPYPVSRNTASASISSATPSRLDDHGRRRISTTTRVEAGGDRTLLDPVVDVGLDPVLDRLPHRRAAVDDRHLRAGTIELERRLRGRVLPADDHDLLPEERVRLCEVVRDVRQILARHAEPIRECRTRRWRRRPCGRGQTGARHEPSACRRRATHRVGNRRVARNARRPFRQTRCRACRRLTRAGSSGAPRAWSACRKG